MRAIYLILAALCAFTTCIASTPLVLFAKIGNSWIQLYSENTAGLAYLHTKFLTGYPIKFLKRKRHIKTTEAERSRFVGLYYNYLVIGPKFMKASFTYDEEGKILGYNFQKCGERYKNKIVSWEYSLSNCTSIDIYLQPLDAHPESHDAQVSPKKKELDVLFPFYSYFDNFHEDNILLSI